MDALLSDVKFLNPMIIRVYDEQLTVAVDGNAVGRHEFTGKCSRLAPEASQELARFREFLDASASRTHPDVAPMVNANTDGSLQVRALELRTEAAGLVFVVAPRQQVFPISIKFLHSPDGRFSRSFAFRSAADMLAA